MAHESLNRIAHRPWPLPHGAWTFRQSWRDLLFAHWPVESSLLRRFVPPALEVQEFDGTSWIAVVPFRMAGVMRRPLPDLPWISAFPELNVRIYVEHEGKPGVWFLSLDATNPLAVWAAKRFFHLPYYRASIDVRPDGDGFRFDCRRSGGGPVLEASYRAVSPPYESSAGTLEHWLTERYCLYAQAPDGTLWRTEVHHVPWPLQKAEAEISGLSYVSVHGLEVGGPPALLHFSRRIDVVVWDPVRL